MTKKYFLHSTPLSLPQKSLKNRHYLLFLSALLLLFFCLFILGCATEKPEIPAWISDSTSAYPKTKYIVGRGLGDTASLARDRARSDLAKTFQVAIHEKSEEKLSYNKSTTDDMASEETNTEISRTINSETYQVIEGVVIAEEWQDPEKKSYQALAILNRMKSGHRLRERINQLDTETEYHIQSAKSEKDLIKKIKEASIALNAQAKRAGHQLILQIIDYTGQGVTPIYEMERLKKDQKDLLNRLKMVVEIQNDPLDQLENLLDGAISVSGFQKRPRESANYALIANLILSPMLDSKGWHWSQGTLMISLNSLTMHQNTYTHRWNLKVSAQNPNILRKRLVDKIDTLLKKELRKVIIELVEP